MKKPRRAQHAGARNGGLTEKGFEALSDDLPRDLAGSRPEGNV